jgi:hypothetical protein
MTTRAPSRSRAHRCRQWYTGIHAWGQVGHKQQPSPRRLIRAHGNIFTAHGDSPVSRLAAFCLHVGNSACVP